MGRTYGYGHHSSIVGLHRNKVVSDDGHHMVVNAELLDALRTRVEDAKKMGFAAGEMEFGEASVVGTFGSSCRVSAIEIHLAVDEVVVRDWSSLASFGHVADNVCQHVEIRPMEVIVQGDRTKIDVVSGTSRSVNNHRTPQAFCILT